MKNLHKSAVSLLVLGGLSLQPVWGMKEDDQDREKFHITGKNNEHTALVSYNDNTEKKSIKIEINFPHSTNWFVYNEEKAKRALFIDFNGSELKIPTIVASQILREKEIRESKIRERIFLDLLASTPSHKIPPIKLFLTMMYNDYIFERVLEEERFTPARNVLSLKHSSLGTSGFEPRYYPEGSNTPGTPCVFNFTGYLLNDVSSPRSSQLLKNAQKFFQVLPPKIHSATFEYYRICAPYVYNAFKAKYHQYINKMQAEFFCSVIKNMNSFAELNLVFSDYTPELTEELFNSNIWTSPLEKLRLKLDYESSQYQITEKLNHVFSKITTSHLNTLCLNRFSFDDKSFDNITRYISNNKSLCWLNLAENKFTDEAFMLLVQALKNSPSLTHLFLSSCDLNTFNILQNFKQYFSDLPSLKYLCLHKNQKISEEQRRVLNMKEIPSSIRLDLTEIFENEK